MKFENFDLHLFDYRAAGGGQPASFRVHVVNSLDGQQKINQADHVFIDEGLRGRLAALETRRLDLEQMIALGKELAALLFPTTVNTYLSGSLARLKEGDRLRIRLQIEEYTLSDIPWEYVYLPNPRDRAEQGSLNGFLALDSRFSIVRFELLQGAVRPLTPLGDGARLRLVAIMADPQQEPVYPPLNLEAELKKIQAALGKLPFLEPSYYTNASVEVLQEALIEGTHIFHFAGHSMFKTSMGSSYGTLEGWGYLVLLDEQGKAFEYKADRLARTLRGRGLRLAVLGACESGRRDQVNAWTSIVPALADAGIPAVVGMQYTIRDDNAIYFSTMFYKALAAGKTVDEAVYEGRLAIYNNMDDRGAERDWGVPVLYLRAEEGVIFPKTAAAGGQFDPNRHDFSVGMSAAVMGAEAIREVFRPPRVAGAVPSHPPAAPGLEKLALEFRVRLLDIYTRDFKDEELRTLCFMLNATDPELQYDNLPGVALPSKARELIDFYLRRKRVTVLLEQSREFRPDIAWPDPPPEFGALPPAGRPAPPDAAGMPARAGAPCSNCGAEVSPGAKFCQQCGRPIRACSNCNTRVAPESRFCSQCGTAVT